MKDKIFGVLQRVGRSFMLPIAILPVAGLFLGLGGSFTNTTMLEAYHLMGVMGPGTPIYALLSVLNAAGNIVFGNLPIIFAMGCAIGMAKKVIPHANNALELGDAAGLPRLARALRRSGLSEEVVERVCWRNAWDYFSRVL